MWIYRKKDKVSKKTSKKLLNKQKKTDQREKDKELRIE